MIQTSLENPCEPLEDGFSSGFVSAEAAESLTFRVILNETNPVYIYSGQGDSCSKGMLQIINPYAFSPQLIRAETDPTRPSDGDGSLEEFKKAAENATTRTPGTDEPVGGRRILTIDVGNDGGHFSPSAARNQIPGTIVRFHFHPKVAPASSHAVREDRGTNPPQNNSVVQASFDKPCRPLQNGFASGFIPIDSSSEGVDFSVVLNDTEPVYFYDAQGSRCRSGMVGSINAYAGPSLTRFIPF